MNKQLTNQPKTLKAVLGDDRVIEQIQRALPSHMSADRMARIAITAATRTPKLNSCTIESVMQSLLDLSAMGLEPDGRHAHLIPYGNTCTLIVDYKGLVEMAYRSGEVTSIHADVIYEGDVFQFSLGKVTRHEPWEFALRPERGEKKGDVIGAYAIVELKGGASKHEVMTWGEIEAIRTRSKAVNSGPWKTDWSEMAKKTVFRRASKWIPLSAEIRTHVERDFDSLPPLQNRQARTSSLNRIVSQSSEPEETESAESQTTEHLESPSTYPEIQSTQYAIKAISDAKSTEDIDAAIGMAEQEFAELKLTKAKSKTLNDQILAAAKAKMAEFES